MGGLVKIEDMISYRPRHIYVESKVLQVPLTKSILRSLAGCSVHEIQDHRRLEHEAVPLKGYDERVKGDVLILAHHPGPCIRPFPGAREEPAPSEFYVAHANGCPFDCQYCFLQGYFAHGAPVLFVNQEDLLEELEDHLEKNAKSRPAVYHAGELSDALALECWSGFARAAIPVLEGYPAARLELRTKCAGVEALLPEGPPSNVTVSWTFTPWDAWENDEYRTPNPWVRIRSARACQEKGYQVGIRLDPALVYPGWESGYESLIREIYARLRPDGIESFVIGGFRYSATLGSRIRERFPSSSLLLPEFVPCRDGKYRYFRPLRVSLYRELVALIRAHDPGARIHLCMETDQVHRDVFAGKAIAQAGNGPR
jgi:spore photoproduct lyase